MEGLGSFFGWPVGATTAAWPCRDAADRQGGQAGAGQRAAIPGGAPLRLIKPTGIRPNGVDAARAGLSSSRLTGPRRISRGARVAGRIDPDIFRSGPAENLHRLQARRRRERSLLLGQNGQPPGYPMIPPQAPNKGRIVAGDYATALLRFVYGNALASAPS